MSTAESSRLDREFDTGTWRTDVYRLLGYIDVQTCDPVEPDAAARLVLIREAIAQFDARHARATRIGRGGPRGA